MWRALGKEPWAWSPGMCSALPGPVGLRLSSLQHSCKTLSSRRSSPDLQPRGQLALDILPQGAQKEGAGLGTWAGDRKASAPPKLCSSRESPQEAEVSLLPPPSFLPAPPWWAHGLGTGRGEGGPGRREGVCARAWSLHRGR